MKVNLNDLREEDLYEDFDNNEDVKEEKSIKKRDERVKTFERLKKNNHKDH